MAVREERGTGMAIPKICPLLLRANPPHWSARTPPPGGGGAPALVSALGWLGELAVDISIYAFASKKRCELSAFQQK